MQEIKRSDTLNIDHIVDYLEKNGLTPKTNLLRSMSNMKIKNVAGNKINEIPAISNLNLILSEGKNNEQI